MEFATATTLQRQVVIETGVRTKNASLQQQGVDPFKKNPITPSAQLLGEVHALSKAYKGLFP